MIHTSNFLMSVVLLSVLIPDVVLILAELGKTYFYSLILAVI